MTEENNRIVTTLDRPIRILIFTPGECMMILLPMIVGVIVGGIVGFCLGLSGIISRKHWLRLRRKYSKRRIQGILYWQLPPSNPKGNIRLPLSYVREYVS